MLSKVIHLIVTVIVYSFWSVVGLALWIPFLARIILGFFFVILYSMLVGSPDNIQNCRPTIDVAMKFYVRGFRSIHKALNNKEAERGIEKDDSRILPFIKEIIWSVIFWGGFIFMFSSFTIKQCVELLHPPQTKTEAAITDTATVKNEEHWLYKLDRKSNVYSCPSENCNIVFRKTYTGMQLEVLEKHDKWFKVKIEKITGYIRAKNLSYFKKV